MSKKRATERRISGKSPAVDERNEEEEEERRLERETQAVREVDEDPSGSIEQHLDMMEKGPLRGDDIIRQTDRVNPIDADEIEIDHPSLPDEYGMQHNYRLDMSESNREGDEMSGDEHSLGLQGGDPDLDRQETLDNGLPGEESEREEERESRNKSAA